MEPSLNQKLTTQEETQKTTQIAPNSEESGEFTPNSDEEVEIIPEEDSSEDTGSIEVNISENEEPMKEKQEEKLPEEVIQQICERTGVEKKKTRHMKRYRHDVDPKYLIAINVLFKREVKRFMRKGQGYIIISVYHSPDCIMVYYYDEMVKERVEEQITQFIDNIVVINIEKRDIERGYNLSLSYQNRLRQENITIFRFMNRRKNVAQFYISGKVDVMVLNEKIRELKRSNFSWFHLYAYRNTRSYRTIFNKIFQKKQFKRNIQNKFNSINVECCTRNPYLGSFYEKDKNNKGNRLNVIFTLLGKTALIHQQADEFISKYVRDNFFLVCFSYKRKQKIPRKDFEAKIPDVQMFFVHEKDNLYSYIFLLTEKRKYTESVDNIIEVMSRLKLNIKGRRYFKGFNPLFNADDLSSKERSWVYPPIDPYSITVVRKNIEEKFDWGSELRRLANEY